MKQFILFFLVLLPVCAFAQFTETFDGPEVNSANPWKGDLNKFSLTDDRQLLFDFSGLADTFAIYTPITFAPVMEWEANIYFSFKPTSSNKLHLYVYRTDKPSNLVFYIEISNAVSLYRWPSKGDAEAMIKGRRELEKFDDLHIKLTLEENARWTLYTRLGNETSFRKEGECEQALQDILNSANLNLTCVCKATSYKDRYVYLDNLIVRHELTDTPLDSSDNPDEPAVADVPELLFVEEEDDNSLLLTFDMSVKAESALIFLSGEKADELYQSEDEMILKPVWLQNRIKGESYTLSYSKIYSKEKGNAECKGSKAFTSTYGEGFGDPDKPEEDEGNDNKPEEVVSGSVLFNEIMAKPGDGQFFEYIELYNTTSSPISLNRWKYKNVTGKKERLFPDISLPAGGYVVLFDEKNKLTVDKQAVSAPFAKFPALNDKGAHLQLSDPIGNLIDEITYQPAKPAKSWERSSDGWHLSSDPRGGTPGSANSSGQGEPEQPEKPVEPDKPAEPEIPDDPSVSPTIKVEPKEFIFNELLPNPFAGGSEYFELYNRSGRSLPLSGLSVAVRKTDGTLSTRYPLSSINTLIEPDDYAVLTKSVEGVADFYMVTSPATLFEMSKLPILANTSSTLVLFRTEDGTIIDEVSYSSKWHASSIKDQKGVALERIDPEAETQSPSNWTSASATAGYGTPGYRNSQSDISFPNEPDKPTGIEAPEWVPGSEHYKITYYLDQPGYSCRAFVFNTIGQRVAEIANHELLGLSGELTWDGESLAGSHLRTGVYIFYAELYHTSGTVKRYKQVFLVR